MSYTYIYILYVYIYICIFYIIYLCSQTLLKLMSPRYLRRKHGNLVRAWRQDLAVGDAMSTPGSQGSDDSLRVQSMPGRDAYEGNPNGVRHIDVPHVSFPFSGTPKIPFCLGSHLGTVAPEDREDQVPAAGRQVPRPEIAGFWRQRWGGGSGLCWKQPLSCDQVV